MDLLNPNVELDLNDDNWKIYSRNPVLPPHYIADSARVQNSLISDGCNIYGQIDFTVIFAGVHIGKGAIVKDSIIMPGAVIHEGAKVQYTIISENVVIGKNAVVGARPEDFVDKKDWGITVIGDNVKIGSGVTVPAKSTVETDIVGVV